MEPFESIEEARQWAVRVKKNARFWVWWAGDAVKITLRPGRTLRASRSWRHEEGWSSESETWEYFGDDILRESLTDGRDCDGRLSTECQCSVPITKLADLGPFDGVMLPAWERESAGQRDYSAEAMGY